MKISKKTAAIFSSLGILLGTAGTLALQTHAASPSTQLQTNSNGPRNFTPPAAMGKVTAISGNTITVLDPKNNTTYTVDVSSATINKFSQGSSAGKPTQTTITASQIAVGDMVRIEGTVSGTQITATQVEDGMPGRGPNMMKRGTNGTVTAINGNTITITSPDGTTYTVDASSANVQKISNASVSNIAVGDHLMVQGTTSGTSVTATNILDGMPRPQNQQSNSSN